MITAIALGARSGTGLVRNTAVLGLALGVAALLLLAAGPVGWRAGWWHYRLAFSTLMPYAFYCGLASIVVSAIGVAMAIRASRRHIVAVAVAGFLLGAVATYFPWRAGEMRGTSPPFHDITTDAANPPSFAFAAAMRQAEQGAGTAYPGQSAMILQQKFYPGIEPALLDLPPAQAFDKALAVAKNKGWTIVHADPAAGVIEAYDCSFWFGFTDDIAIRVTPDETESRVDIRSGSRQGRGDFGVNAARVRGFLAALK